MKIRTITTGFNIELPLKEEQIKHIANLTHKARRLFESRGYAVQTVRIATQPWERYFESRDQIVSLVKVLEDLAHKYGLDYSNVGTTVNEKLIPIIYDMMKSTSHMFCTVLISDDRAISYERATQTAKLIKRISRIGKDGFSNLRFAAIFNTGPGSPFYPAAYHEGPTSFAIGTENSDLVNKAFARAKTIEEAGMCLREVLAEEFKRIEEIAEEISVTEKVKYDGIDASIATSVAVDESIAYAFEKLGFGRFGDVGTLAIAKIITDTVKGLDVKKCGYSGLMLPVLEDYGLAKRNAEGAYNLGNLLLYSSVCGTGLDTIPLPGDISEKKLFSLLLDIASLSIALDKPLSARLMPIPGKRIGEMTQYQFEYFANSRIMKI
ncbi:MAG: DUF711 family protein [Deltaproteobacteria bacterium]|nr:MAG: DUF711 family protein [Deltaproteobacteria bacterium]